MPITDEQKRHIDSIRETFKDRMNINSVEPLCASKQFSYLIKYDGDKKSKAKIFPFMPKHIEWQYHLMKFDDDCPKIMFVDERPGQVIKIQEWIEGKDIRDLSGKLEFKYVDNWIFRSWGEYMGSLHNIKFENKHLSIYDMFWFNFIVIRGNKVICCDMSKLIPMDFPERDIFEWILFNQTMPDDKKEHFIDGYLNKRKLRYGHQLKAANIFVNRIREACIG